MPPKTPIDAEATALRALATTLGKPDLSQRFLDLTGIGTGELRKNIGEPALLAALIRFLEAHEPDLVEVAEEIGMAPDELVAARRILEGQEEQ
jgi:hypothetical protein